MRGRRNNHKIATISQVVIFILLRKRDYFVIFSSFVLAFYTVENVCYKWTERSAVEVNIENERFTVVCSRCRKSLKFHFVV